MLCWYCDNRNEELTMYELISTKVHILRPVCNCKRKILPRANFIGNALLFLILYMYCELSARQKRGIQKNCHCDILCYYKQSCTFTEPVYWVFRYVLSSFDQIIYANSIWEKKQHTTRNACNCVIFGVSVSKNDLTHYFS